MAVKQPKQRPQPILPINTEGAKDETTKAALRIIAEQHRLIVITLNELEKRIEALEP
jgi:hypothetical protein